MAKLRTSASFSVSENIARRLGLWGLRYLSPDGRVLLSEADLRRLRLEPSEYVHGIDAEEITAEEANSLIAEGGYRMLPEQEPQEPPVEEVPDENDAEPVGDENLQDAPPAEEIAEPRAEEESPVDAEETGGEVEHENNEIVEE